MVAVLLTCLSAAAYTASFPPLGASPLVWVSLVPLLVAVTRVSPGRAALLGLLWSVGVGIGVAWWLPGMVANYFEQPWIAGWIGFAAVVVGLGGTWVALGTAWISWMARRGAVGPLLVAAAWGASEISRARLLVGNPWVLAAYSQVHVPRLMQIADATGPYGVGMLIAGVNAVLASIGAPALRGRRPIASASAVAAALLATLAYGTWRLGQSVADGPPLSVAVVQGAVERGMRWRPEYRTLGVDRYMALTRKAAVMNPRLVVWPETAISFYLQEPTPQGAAILEGERALGADLILGGPHYEIGPGGTIYHNSVFVVRDGRVAGRYDKMRLLPFAERNLPGRLARVEPTYTPGTTIQTLDAAGVRIGTFVCWEAMYPELVRRFALAGAELFANLSNDSWFGLPTPAEHHLDVASVRAIENRRYLIRATPTGFSAVVDPYGRIVARSRFGAEDIVIASVSPSTRSTPYQWWGDTPSFLAIAALVAASVQTKFRPATRRKSA